MNSKKSDAVCINTNGNFTTWRKDSCCRVSLGVYRIISSGSTKIHFAAAFGTRTAVIVRFVVEDSKVFVIAKINHFIGSSKP